LPEGKVESRRLLNNPSRRNAAFHDGKSSVPRAIC
jgi:hypothetical protein